MTKPFTLTPPRLQVLRLIAEDRDLADYSPEAGRPGYIARGGNYPATLAWRIAVQLRKAGLVDRVPNSDRWFLTRAGVEALASRG